MSPSTASREHSDRPAGRRLARPRLPGSLMAVDSGSSSSSRSPLGMSRSRVSPGTVRHPSFVRNPWISRTARSGYFGEQYEPDDTSQTSRVFAASRSEPENRSESSLSSLLAANGTLSERELRHPSLPVVGILDLIRATDDGVLVVDFKTGAAKSEHQEQVELYALLWWRNSGEMPVRIAVQYPERTAGMERYSRAAGELRSYAGDCCGRCFGKSWQSTRRSAAE